MALEHALLVALTERAGTGYELARRFDKSIGYFWDATHQQIYRVLRRMTQDGWLDCESVPQQGRPDKKVYSVNAAGSAELARWIATPTDAETQRNALAVKVRGAAYGDLAAVHAEVKRHREQHAERLALYHQIERRDFPNPAQLADSSLHQYLVLRAGIQIETGTMQWCDEVLTCLNTSVSSAPTAHAESEPNP